MKQIDKLQARARQRFGFCGSLIIHFLLFIVLAFSGIFVAHVPAGDATDVVYFDAGGGGGGGGSDTAGEDETVEEAGEEQVEEVVEQETITLPDGRQEQKPVVHKVVKHVPAAVKKGSGTGTGGGQGSGHGTGTGSGTGPGSGSGSGGGHGAGHGTGVGDGNGAGIARQPAVPPRVLNSVAAYYPPGLKQAGIEGRSVMQLVIGTNGAVESVELLESSGNGTLDESAMAAARKWRFSPAKNSAGQKVRCYYVLPYRFRITYN